MIQIRDFLWRAQDEPRGKSKLLLLWLPFPENKSSARSIGLGKIFLPRFLRPENEGKVRWPKWDQNCAQNRHLHEPLHWVLRNGCVTIVAETKSCRVTQRTSMTTRHLLFKKLLLLLRGCLNLLICCYTILSSYHNYQYRPVHFGALIPFKISFTSNKINHILVGYSTLWSIASNIHDVSSPAFRSELVHNRSLIAYTHVGASAFCCFMRVTKTHESPPLKKTNRLENLRRV